MPKTQKQEFIALWNDLVKQIRPLSDTGDWAFRGESCFFPSMHAAIDRTSKFSRDLSLQDLLNAERDSTAEFFSHAAGSTQGTEASLLSEWLDTQALIRHYGGPTRLLDWSRDWRIATFWACESEPRNNGRIYAFNHRVLDDHISTNYQDEWISWLKIVRHRAGMPIPALLDLTHAKSFSEVVVPVLVNNPFPRVVVQRGMFTIGVRPKIDHWQAIVDQLEPSEVVQPITIPAEAKKFFMSKLANSRINHAFLLPGPEGAAKHAWATYNRKTQR